MILKDLFEKEPFNCEDLHPVGDLKSICASVTIYHEKTNKIFYLGGKSEEERLDIISSFNLSTMEFKQESKMKRVRSRFSGALLGDCIYFYGGINNNDFSENSLEKYDLSLNSSLIIPVVPCDQFGSPSNLIITSSFFFGTFFYHVGSKDDLMEMWKIDFTDQQKLKWIKVKIQQQVSPNVNKKFFFLLFFFFYFFFTF